MNNPFNFAQHVFEINRSNSDKIAYIDNQGTISYGNLDRRSHGLASRFHHLGIKPGTRIVICRPDDHLTVISFLALLLVGAVPVLINSRCSRDYFKYCVEQSDPQWILSGESTAEFAKEIKPEHTIFDKQLNILSQFDFYRPVTTQGSDPAYWIFTSGTTGEPRAVVHSHWNLRSVGHHYGILTDGVTSSDTVYSTAKLSFAYGICHSLASTLMTGSTAILTTKLPTPESILSTIRQHSPTIFVTVPTVYSMLLNSELDLSNLGLKQCTSAGEDLPTAVHSEWEQRTKIPMLNLYGCTEFSGCVLANTIKDSMIGTVGRPTQGYHCELRDHNGEIVSQGQTGELWVQGPSLALGYHDDPTAFDKGWFNSQDLFCQDNQGRYIFQGRSDDRFKVNGQWVSPLEIERVLLERPDISEVAVSRDNNEIVAYIVPTLSQSLDIGAIQSYLRRKLESHKCPNYFYLVSCLPRTINGKIQRRLLEQGTPA